jgi:hypothetical protein
VVAWLLLVCHTGMCFIRSLLLTGFDRDAQEYASRLRRQRGRFQGAGRLDVPSRVSARSRSASLNPWSAATGNQWLLVSRKP